MTDHIAPDDPALLASVRLGEGLRLIAYPDPESPRGKELAKPPKLRAPGWATLSGAPWTYGYGCTGPEITQSSTCTKDQAERLMVERMAEAMATLDGKEPWWRGMTAGRQRVLAEMCYNLGYGHLIGFHRMLADLQAQHWAEAAAEMRNSLWAKQTHERAARLAQSMELG